MARRVLTVAMLALGWPAWLVGQSIIPVPGGVVGGKVVVRVYVTLRDQETPYYPVGGLQLRFFRSAKDSVVATTDDAGTVTTLLFPGDYRLVSARDVVWKGNHYSWSLPLTVKAGMSPIDLREPIESAPAPNATQVDIREASPPPSPAEKAPAVDRRESAPGVARQGFWISIGLGAGSLGCENCSGTESVGLSGNLSLGGAVDPQALVGVFSNGWTKTENGVMVSVGTLTAGLRFYPSLNYGFFIIGGFGISSIRADLVGGGGSAAARGTGSMVGVGWDLQISKGLSLTPFYNFVAANSQGVNAHFSQVGLGLTWP